MKLQTDYPCVMASDVCTSARILVWCGWMCCHHVAQWAVETADKRKYDVLVCASPEKPCQMCGVMTRWLGGHPNEQGLLICEDCAMDVFDSIHNGQRGQRHGTA